VAINLEGLPFKASSHCGCPSQEDVGLNDQTFVESSRKWIEN